MLAPPRARAAERCFPETGFCIGGRFLDYWQQHGGLAVNGYPLTAERQEFLEDNEEYSVQYFERSRFEYHPRNAAPNDVLLSTFGRQLLLTVRPVVPTARAAPLPEQRYFAETGHNLGGRFLAYWSTNGGLMQFGFPLTEELPETLLEDGNRYTVQWFERGRLELHPENPAPDTVLLAQFGRFALARNDQIFGERGFALLYSGNEHVRRVLGVVAPYPYRGPSQYLGFERGAMLLQYGRVYLFCSERPPGEDHLVPRVRIYSNWRPEPDPGVSPAPPPGLFLPGADFGLVWQQNPGVRACLGYATAPGARSYTGTVQSFGRGAATTCSWPIRPRGGSSTSCTSPARPPSPTGTIAVRRMSDTLTRHDDGMAAHQPRGTASSRMRCLFGQTRGLCQVRPRLTRARHTALLTAHTLLAVA